MHSRSVNDSNLSRCMCLGRSWSQPPGKESLLRNQFRGSGGCFRKPGTAHPLAVVVTFIGKFRGKIIGIIWYNHQMIDGIQWLVDFKWYSYYRRLYPWLMVQSITQISTTNGEHRVWSDGFMRLDKAELGWRIKKIYFPHFQKMTFR